MNKFQKRSRILWLVSVSFVISIGLFTTYTYLASNTATTVSANKPIARPQRGATPAPPLEIPTPAAPPTPVVAQPAASQPTLGCTGQIYQKPSPLNTAQLPLGATIQREQPQQYELFGSDIGEIRQSMRQCAPRTASAGSFHALTGYNITWSYTVSPEQNGTCSLRNVRVGSHIAQYMPLYRQSSDAKPQWDAYHAALTAHENGHVDINIRHVQSLTTRLQSLQNVDCASLPTFATEAIKSELALLASSNELYDANTGHGSSQGAVL